MQHPGFQSAVVPFGVSLVLGGALARTRLAPVAIFAGVMACVYLAVGPDLFPLNATRRIIVLTLVALGLGLVVDRLPGRMAPPGGVRAALAGAAGAAAGVWVTLAALANRDAGEALVLGGLVGAAGAVLAVGFDRLAGRPVRAGCAALGAGLGVGAATILSASALLGQIGLALGSAAATTCSVRNLR